MMLSDLVKYYEALVNKGILGGEGWELCKVGYGIVLGEDGQVLDIRDIRESVKVGKKSKLVPVSKLFTERAKRSTNIAANYMMDNTSYMISSIEDLRKFTATQDLHMEVLKGFNGSAARKVKNYFNKYAIAVENNEELKHKVDECIKNAQNITFIDEKGNYLIDDNEIRDAWNKYKSENSNDETDGRCILTGEPDKIARTHGKIKGFRNAQSSGASLVSNASSCSESYGMEDAQSINSRVGEYASFAYVNAVNYMLTRRENSNYIGNACVCVWTDEIDSRLEEIISRYIILNGLNEEGMKYAKEHKNETVHIACLVPNTARIAEKFYYVNSCDEVIKALDKFSEIVSISYADIDKVEYSQRSYGLSAIMNETVNQNGTDIDERISTTEVALLMQSIFKGIKFPESVYLNILKRINNEKKISYSKVGFIKAYLIRNCGKEELIKMGLNDECEDKAYIIGRMVSIMDSIQYAATGNSNIAERHLSSMSAAPGQILPILLVKVGQFAEKNGKCYEYKNKLEEMLGKLGGKIPDKFDLSERGMFMLGYYHEEQDKFRRINEAKIKKEQNK